VGVDTLATPSPIPPRADLERRARAVLDAAWRPPGFCVPNPVSYPWQWLWDSCFHAVAWRHLGRPDRAVTELSNALRHQAADGFVPHMTYWSAGGSAGWSSKGRASEARADDTTHAAFWGRVGTSSITQPPMYGHAIAELDRGGVAVPEELVERARLGLAFLLEQRRRDGGPAIVHPWESGCDDSPSWDAWCGPAWSPGRWHEVKGDLVEALGFAPTGSSVSSRAFEVVASGFGALVAFNARELADVTGDHRLRVQADDVASAIDGRWRPDRVRWDDLVPVGPRDPAPARTLHALLPVLVSADDRAVDRAFGAALDPGAYGGACGPAGVHRDEPAFDPTAYWRGPAWPQLTYLLWVAARRRGHAAADGLRDRLRTGAHRSGFAEYWDPDTGVARGAAPQSWTALAAVVD